MRPALSWALLLSACAGANAPAPPQAARPVHSTPVAATPAQVWRGALRCRPIRGIARQPLNQPVEVIVSGGVARYEHAVRRPDPGGAADVHEIGEGTIAPDGSLTLTGQASAQLFRYSAQYSGMLQPDGGPSRLAGKQSWYANRASPVERNCSMMLRREG